MSRHRTRWLRRIGLATLVIILVVSVAYLLLGWGLEISDREASYQYIETWTEAAGRSFDDPFGIAVDVRNGNVLVTDARNQRVVIFSPEGKLLRQFGTEGTDPGQFKRPTGIAVGPDGSIYVSDFFLDRIQKFSQDSEFILQWDNSGEGDGYLQGPNGLAVDRKGLVYVTDFQNNVVKVFTGKGEYLRTIGKPGQWGARKLDYPTDVAVTTDLGIVIADAYNHRLQRFTLKGNHQASWGWHIFQLVPRPAGNRNGFHVPTGVTFDTDHKLIHIVDSANHRVVMLDTGGAFVTDWVLPEPYKSNSPTMLATSPDGTRVYATDTVLDRIIVLHVTLKD